MLILTLAANPTTAPPAREASIADRTGMSVEIADYIKDAGRANEFKTGAVEVGAAAIEGQTALADWRSADGKERGQVTFFHSCDHWNLGRVSIGHAITANGLHASHLPGSPSVDDAIRLVDELRRLEVRHVAFLAPARAGISC